MDVIDLTKARAERADNTARAQAACDTIYDCAKLTAKAYADLAFSVSHPLFEPCRQLAVDINCSQLRRAKVVFRGQIRRLKLDPEVVATLMRFIADAYWDAINHLWWDHLRSIGRDPQAEATAELLAEQKPWPSCFVLTPEAIVAWIDLIGRTGGNLKPSTKAELALARSELSLGHVLAGETEQLIDRLIRARWRQGHTMPWESKWAKLMDESA